MEMSDDPEKMIVAPETLTRKVREQLLDGPAVLIAVLCDSSQFHQSHQLSAASMVVARDRRRQLSEQAELLQQNQGTTRTLIEFPVRALEAVSNSFDKTLCVPRSELHLGTILPGYLMEVLDWYCSALRANDWRHFLPEEPSIEEDDKFFWLYIYITMRKVGMHHFANKLGNPFIQLLIGKHQLADDACMLDFLLRNLSTDDLILPAIAERYVYLHNIGQCPLLPEQWDAIFQNYNYFAILMEKYQQLLKEIEHTQMIMGNLGIEGSSVANKDEV